MTKTPSPAAKIVPATRTIELSQQDADGAPVRVRIRAVKSEALLAVLGMIPGHVDPVSAAKASDDPASREHELAQAKGMIRQVVELCVLEPLFWFDSPEDGKSAWDDLHPDAQTELVGACISFSGAGGLADDRLSFPARGREGRSNGVRGDGDRQVRDATAPGAGDGEPRPAGSATG